MAPTWQGQRDDSSGWISFSVRARPITFVAALVGGVLSLVAGGVLLGELKRTGISAPDGGVQEVASIAEGEESRKPKKPKKPKEPPPDPVPDDEPPKKPKQPTVTGAVERMAGEPELETCVKGSTREQGCPPP